MNWLPEDMMLLREMREQGIPFSACAQTLGRSANSCIGKARRMGIVRVHGHRKNPNHTTSSKKTARSTPATSKQVFTKIKQDHAVASRNQASKPASKRVGTMIFDLTDAQCGFEVGRNERGFRIFCGMPAVRGRRCEEHAKHAN